MLPSFSSQSILDLQRRVASLLLYQSVLQASVIQAFLTLLQALRQEDGDACLKAYGQWFQGLASVGMSWTDYLLLQILQTEQPFSRQAQQPHPIPSALIAAAQHDLRVLQQLYGCTSQQLSEQVQFQAQLESPPVVWDMSPDPTLHQYPIIAQFQQRQDWGTLVSELVDHYRQFGAGRFATYRAFRWQRGQLQGVAHPDPIRLGELTGYESQKASLQQNTEALLAGYPALHVLLYGSRGSGKSSLVKALLSEYGSRGLRLIEVSRAELGDLPAIVEFIRGVPQKFIIFVDDLSFEADDEGYKALKVVLEGNITARPANGVVYATSNRRHLIREFFADRPRPSDADEIHHWDTVQEKLSFSDRFGLTLTFEPANQDTYLKIVHHLAQQAAIPLPAPELEFQALQWATRQNGRSGRSARQFVDQLQARWNAFSSEALPLE